MLTIIIPNYNGAKWLEICLDSLKRSTFKHFKLIVVDNNSKDNSLAVFQEYNFEQEWVQLAENFGFAKAVNEGIRRVTTKYAMLLNNDTKVAPNALQLLIEKLERLPDQIAALQPLMLRLDNPAMIDDSGDQLSWFGITTKGNHKKNLRDVQLPIDIFSPSGGAVVYQTAFLKKIGNFDESFNSYLEDVDVGLRGKLLGFSYQLLPEAIIYHKGGGSNIPTQRYTRLVVKNRLILFVKNIPSVLLFKNFHKILYGQLIHFLAYGRPWTCLLGYIDFVKILPKVLLERKRMLKEVRLSNQEIHLLLDNGKPNVTLVQAIVDFFYTIFRRLFL